MLVLKFGGTSVGSPQAIEKLLSILKSERYKGRVRVVVVSAFSGVTDSLIEMANRAADETRSVSFTYPEALSAIKTRHIETARALLTGAALEASLADLEAGFADLTQVLDGIRLIGEFSARTLDLVMSFGERLSAALIARVAAEGGLDCEYLDSRALIKTNDEWGKAVCLPEETYRNIENYLAGHPKMQVAAGFIASTRKGITTTLGRGGSDLSAAIYGAAINAEAVEIWTDVDGILTADPRLVKNAFTIPDISSTEAMELSHFGAKVLHPPTIRPALERNIPILIRNTFNPSSSGTRITGDLPDNKWPVRGISSVPAIALVRVQGPHMVGAAGFASRLFGSLSREKINVILITQASSEYSICFAIAPGEADRAVEALSAEFEREIERGTLEKPAVQTGLSIIAVVGANMQRRAGLSGKLFYALGRNGINVVAIAQGSSELNISAVVSSRDRGKAMNAIHEAFFQDSVRSVNLFLVGPGLIGGTLLTQIASQRHLLLSKYKIRINLTGISNSRNMLIDSEGLDPADAKERLSSGETASLGAFLQRMKEMNLPNTVFCDCTASEAVACEYEGILKAAIPVVTPNKKANSGAFSRYQDLTGYSRDRGIPYLYETTVCAGLPVISTLRDLHLSGDTVRRIEAVLSGTLSFIFNNFDGSKPFSALVREAKQKGYTEPDPRDDLNAMDAARKALILSRECGMEMEFSQVEIEPILGEACFKAPDVEAFFKELEKSDAAFEKRRSDAAKTGKSLRYVAVVEEGKARLSLREEAASSPFCSLRDSDNIVVISTDRYSALPMVIKGPGAGAQVTAGGVFADIVRLARTLV